MTKSYRSVSYAILGVLIIFAWLHLNGGRMEFHFSEIWNSLFNFSDQNQDLIIYREVRIPRTFIAIIAGAGLSIAGLLMQTLFSNPLAGPSVLGITSGSSLLVAISMLTGISFFASDYGIVAVALIGAVIFSLIILLFSMFVKSHVSLLLIGIMLGGFTNAIIQVLQVSSKATQLKVFTLWGFGSMQQVSFSQIPLILAIFGLGIISLVFLIKPLNLLVIGEKSTRLLGIQLQQFRILIIVVTAIFAGLITAYCGPISFIGLAVPNIVKILYKTQNHLQLIIGSALIGAISLLFCDLIVLWLEPWILLPLNGVTALFGSPIVVWIILKRF
ncbi:MAG: iron ABC transporter permease [Crocinitomicaceae bacterium]|nr:iron ABC transporter permease [Crocinitomicaceae bacterium]